MDSYEILKFASLFHEIGKFYQRADNLNNNFSYDSKYDKLNENDYGKNCDYVKWSADFVKDYFNDFVENLVLFHQKPKNSEDENLCNIIKKASKYSSPEIINEDDDKNEESLLVSIFSKINLYDNKSNEKYVPLVELDFNNDLSPKDKNELEVDDNSKKYAELWKNFTDEFKRLNNIDFETSLALVKKYTSTMPLNSFKYSNDISLYNHLKSTTAIANCLYLFSKENELHINDDDQEKFKIINGDISGIQDFIYKISSPDEAQSGMNKRLRGRSLYLTLLNESIVDDLIKELCLDSSNIIFCGGGRFTLLAPNTSKTDEIIKNINLKVNKYFINNFNAELYLALESVSASGNDLQNFDKIIKKLTNRLNINKKRKFSNLLEDIFDINEETHYTLCPICGNPIDDFCEECSKHETLGQKIANAKFLIKYSGDQELGGLNIFQTTYLFEKSEKNLKKLLNSNNVNFFVYKLNDTNFLELANEINNKNVSFDFKAMGNVVPHIKKNNKILYFNHLAEISKGANKLGILKMDVDNLGLLFSNGFKNIEKVSVSRISSLSFYLDLFFSGYINIFASKFKVYSDTCGYDEKFEAIKLDFISDKQYVYKPLMDVPQECEEYSISTIHINYSGGDDLLVLGPYDDIISFSQEFRNEFKKWTAENDSINISGGIFICGPKFPIGKAAILADDELEKSKKCGRNKITIFNEVLNWDSNGIEKGFDELFDFAKYLESKVGNGISKSFVYSLLNIWQKTSKCRIKSYTETEWDNDMICRLNSKGYIRYFKYKLRIIKNKNVREEIDKKGVKYMPWIKTPVSWISLRLR